MQKGADIHIGHTHKDVKGVLGDNKTCKILQQNLPAGPLACVVHIRQTLEICQTQLYRNIAGFIFIKKTVERSQVRRLS